MRTNTPCYVHIEAEVSMVDVASLICFKKLCKNILILMKPRANAQLVVKSVVIPGEKLMSELHKLKSSCKASNRRASNPSFAGAQSQKTCLGYELLSK